MDSARTARYLLAVATIAVTISLGCAAPVFGVTISIPKKPADSASSSLLEKLPQLPKITVNFNSENIHSPQPSETDCETSSDDKKQGLQPEPTVDKQQGGHDSHQSSENASQVTSPKPKLETTTDDRSGLEVAPDHRIMAEAPKDD